MNKNEVYIPSRTPMVREYTKEERVAINATPSRIANIAIRTEIDKARYLEASSAFPEKSDHFERLISVGAKALIGWQEYYQDNDELRTAMIPYSGTEGPGDIPAIVAVPDSARAHLPA